MLLTVKVLKDLLCTALEELWVDLLRNVARLPRLLQKTHYVIMALNIIFGTLKGPR